MAHTALLNNRAGRASVSPTSRTSRSAARALPFVAALLAPALIAQLLPGATAWLEYDRDLIGRGQLWRALTCHWAHWDLEHFVWDATVLGALVAAGWHVCRKRVAWAIAGAAFLIPLAISLLQPDMLRYRGLSGFDFAVHALLVVSIYRGTARRGVRALCSIALIAMGAKCVFELTTGSAMFVESAAFTPAPLAHLVGAFVGTAAALLPPLHRVRSS